MFDIKYQVHYGHFISEKMPLFNNGKVSDNNEQTFALNPRPEVNQFPITVLFYDNDVLQMKFEVKYHEITLKQSNQSYYHLVLGVNEQGDIDVCCKKSFADKLHGIKLPAQQIYPGKSMDDLLKDFLTETAESIGSSRDGSETQTERGARPWSHRRTRPRAPAAPRG